MFVHYGKRLSRKKLGFAADFCPICREVRAFRVSELRRVAHLNYIPLGKGDLLHHEVICQRCQTIQPLAALRYTACVPMHKGDAFDLAERTNPDIAEHCAELIELERCADEGTLNAEQRARLIFRAIAALDYMARLRKQEGALRPGAAYSGLAALFAVLVAVLAWADPRFGWVARASTSVGAACLLWLAIRMGLGAKRWWVVKNAYPRLARALVSLAPTTEELRHALAAVGSGGGAISKIIDLDDLDAFLRRAGGAPS